MNGLCECRCGQPAPIAKHDNPRYGWVKGQPKRFINGHQAGMPKRARKHGFARKGKTPEYRTYLSAKYRCTGRNGPDWKDYGGAGIKFLFASFEEFFAELGPKPTAAHSIDRYPNGAGNYEKGNVRWATKSEQCFNRRPWKKGKVAA